MDAAEGWLTFIACELVVILAVLAGILVTATGILKEVENHGSTDDQGPPRSDDPKD